METALRVLTAITERQRPVPADIEELHRLAPDHADLPLDELACEVINWALKESAVAPADDYDPGLSHP